MIHIIECCIVGANVVNAEVGRQLDAFEPSCLVLVRSDGHVGTATHVIACINELVIVKCTHTAEVIQVRTGNPIVKLFVSKLVQQVITGIILKPYRVNGGHELGAVPNVGVGRSRVTR